MATEVILTGITCRIDADQDPEQLICVWRGNEVISGDAFIIENSTPAFETMEDELANSMGDLDYEFP